MYLLAYPPLQRGFIGFINQARARAGAAPSAIHCACMGWCATARARSCGLTRVVGRRLGSLCVCSRGGAARRARWRRGQPAPAAAPLLCTACKQRF